MPILELWMRKSVDDCQCLCSIDQAVGEITHASGGGADRRRLLDLLGFAVGQSPCDGLWLLNALAPLLQLLLVQLEVLPLDLVLVVVVECCLRLSVGLRVPLLRGLGGRLLLADIHAVGWRGVVGRASERLGLCNGNGRLDGLGLVFGDLARRVECLTVLNRRAVRLETIVSPVGLSLADVVVAERWEVRGGRSPLHGGSQSKDNGVGVHDGGKTNVVGGRGSTKECSEWTALEGERDGSSKTIVSEVDTSLNDE